MLDILPEKEGRHLLIAVLKRAPALDQDVAFGKPAAQGNRTELVIHEEFMEVILVMFY